MGTIIRRTAEIEADLPRPSTVPFRRPPISSTPVARYAVLYGFLLCIGYLAGVLHHRCSSDGTSAFSRWAAVVLHRQPPTGDSDHHGSTAMGSQQEDQQLVNPPVATAPPPPPLPTNFTLRFPVCNGFANQRLSILYGVLLAKRLNRAAVLPMLVDNGLQRSGSSVLAGEGNQLPFGEMYDLPYFLQSMERAGVRVLLPEDAPPSSAYQNIVLDPAVQGNMYNVLKALYGAVQHLAIDCPLFRFRASDMTPADADVLWAVLNGLRPTKEATALVNRIGAAISSVGDSGAARGSAGGSGGRGSGGSGSGGGVSGGQPSFNFIHLRIENDWLAHCARWEAIPDGVVRDNCYRNTETVAQQLQLFGLKPEVPLYVAAYWEDVEPGRKDKMLSSLTSAGYRVVTSADVFPLVAPELLTLGREYRAMIEYFVGLQSLRFIGNSVSTFAALGLMERRYLGRWAAYYNGGNVPLATLLPLLHRLPWFFTYNSWSPGYDYLLKGAVRSAAATHSFQPYCLFMGTSSSTIYHWLVQQNVTIIRHEPKWRNKLVAMADRRKASNLHHSHLFKTADSIVSTFQRVDLPVVPVLDQYTYVLYTDVDVYFRRPITLDDFGLPLPTSVSMSYEMVNMFPYNAGVIVINLPTLRVQYDQFISAMLDNDDGLYYPNYGPADQGIINKFYEKDLRARMLSQLFNAKPYNAFDPAAFIVHFHGPKPHELAAFLDSGQCDFKGLCERDFQEGFCHYLKEWSPYVPDEAAAVRLNTACSFLVNPVLKRLRGVGRRQLLHFLGGWYADFGGATFNLG